MTRVDSNAGITVGMVPESLEVFLDRLLESFPDQIDRLANYTGDSGTRIAIVVVASSYEIGRSVGLCDMVFPDAPAVGRIWENLGQACPKLKAKVGHFGPDSTKLRPM